MTRLVLIFLAGLIVDLMVARYTLAIADRRRGLAVFLSVLITAINLGLIGVLIGDFQSYGYYSILTYAAGNGAGTLIAMR